MRCFFLVEIFDAKNGCFRVESDRYRMLFSFENAYGIFRLLGKEASLRSDDYEMICYEQHASIAPIDVLKDLFYIARAGDADIRINDVVCIKINGAIVSYRFSGLLSHDPEQSCKSFGEVPEFLTNEKKKYVSKLHRENKVLNVLDGKVYSLEELSPNDWTFYSIDKEVFKKTDYSAGIATDYSLYALKDSMIQEISPFRKPFATIHLALFCFNKHKHRCYSMLLLSRAELERIRDFNQLKKLLA